MKGKGVLKAGEELAIVGARPHNWGWRTVVEKSESDHKGP